ncbi:periplasmic serine protease [Microbacterium testaceum StLB037]|uniref:Periplasmic serine protease n=1 Tax=Microbacterium testaceum (strain StLB037) TaxID=979556 RepID=E8NA24_MICTS|nr:hypothetical protein [Microbacterium testaceum]BAJ75854.1 periplasmic serine protease [Microbacterium testaceum StLB037]
MRLRTTSTQRTYRYVRLSIVGATLVLAVSIGLEVAGRGALSSLSAAFYTPAGHLFVGSLCAIALALLVLSGRSVEQGLLDLAAVFALVVALVPTPITDASCEGGAVCVPAAAIPGVVNSGISVASLSLVVLVAAAVLARTQGSAGWGTVVTLVAIALTVAGFVTWALVDFPTFLRGAHNVAAVGFFSVIGVVAAVSAWRPQRAPRRFRVLYAVVAVGILGALCALVAVLVAGGAATVTVAGVPAVFLGESVVVTLFAVFWLVQTVELWNAPDPTLRA